MDFTRFTSFELLSFFYIFSNIICIAIFCFILRRSLSGMNVHSSGKLFNLVLITHIIYFIMDIIWAPLNFDLIDNYVLLQIIRILKYCNIVVSAFAWFEYISYKIENVILNTKKKFVTGLCLNILSFILIFVVCLNNDMSLNNNLTIMLGFVINILPFLWIMGAVINCFYVLFNSAKSNYKKMLLLSLYTIVLLLSGGIQIVFPQIPILCFLSALVMIVMYTIDLQGLIYTDPLTNLNNRNNLLYYYEESLKSAEDVALIMIDVDKFKHINDKFGHLIGDKALISMGKALNKISAAIKSSFAARYGGDEFVIILRTNKTEDVEHFMGLVNKEVGLIKLKKDYPISISYGYTFKKKDDSLESLIRRADKELYIIKNEKNRFN